MTDPLFFVGVIALGALVFLGSTLRFIIHSRRVERWDRYEA